MTPPVAEADLLPIVVELGEEEEVENYENIPPSRAESPPALEEIPENEVPLPMMAPSLSTRAANAVSVTSCVWTLGHFKKPAPYWIKTGMARVRDNTRGRHRKVYGRCVYVVDVVALDHGPCSCIQHSFFISSRTYSFLRFTYLITFVSQDSLLLLFQRAQDKISTLLLIPLLFTRPSQVPLNLLLFLRLPYTVRLQRLRSRHLPWCRCHLPDQRVVAHLRGKRPGTTQCLPQLVASRGTKG
jgi:hypothetical protein